eukprot:scaffold2576_cov175-Amphora_coffeaeformis.AAC.15
MVALVVDEEEEDAIFLRGAVCSLFGGEKTHLTIEPSRDASVAVFAAKEGRLFLGMCDAYTCTRFAAKAAGFGDRVSLEEPATIDPENPRKSQRFPLLFKLGLPATRLLATGIVTAVAAAKCLQSQAVRRAAYFWRTAGPMIGHYKWTQWWLGVNHADRQHRDVVYERLHNRYADPALDIIMHLKGLYCKIGQVLSARPDFLPHQYVTRFASVQDAIPQWPAEKVAQILQDSLQANFGYDFEDVFDHMDPVALGSASIGQTHRAVLTERFARLHKYREVAVKVMHPDAQACFQHDFQVFRWVCRLALPGWKGLLDELETRFLSEFDYHTEAASLATVRANMQRSRFRRQVCVPEPLPELCTKNVLVMEMLQGRKLVDAMRERLAESLGGNRQLASDFLEARRQKVLLPATTIREEKLPINSLSWWQKMRLLSLRRRGKQYVNTLIAVHGHQILQDGCTSLFNGDPHPGNCLELSDGRLGLIDYGQTRRLTDTERLALARVIVALGTNANPAVIAESMQAAGFVAQDNKDYVMWTKYATLFFDSDMESQRLGFPTPQLYFVSLMEQNPLIEIPDAFVFVARVSFLFRGMGSGIGIPPVCTSHYWLSEARAALRRS